MKAPNRRPYAPRAFSLVELLVVMAIIAILGGLALPAISSLTRSSSLTSGGSRLIDQLQLARQTAMARNCRVEFRLYKLPDPTVSASTTPTIYRAFQSYSLDANGAQTNAVTKVTYLPDGISIVNDPSVSSLLPATPGNPPYSVQGTASGASLGTYPAAAYSYMAFHFRPDGSTDLDPNAPVWFVSLANQRDAVQVSTGVPKNFVTVQVDAQSGRVRSFRPN